MSKLPPGTSTLNGNNREGWLAARWEVVTGTRISVILGESPWKTREQLLEEYLTRTDTFVMKRAPWWGSRLELPLVEAAGDLLGYQCEPSHDMFIRGDCGATIDGHLLMNPPRSPVDAPNPSSAPRAWDKLLEAIREASRGQERLLIEMKLVGAARKQEWKTPPTSYWCQVQWGLRLTGLDYGVLMAKVGAHDMRGHLIQRDDFWGDYAEEMAGEFMKEVRKLRND